MFDNQDLVNEIEKLSRFAKRLTGNVSDADDLLQATLLRAIEKKELFEQDSNLFSWSSKVMYNLFVTNYRRKVKFETQYDPESFLENKSVDANQDNIVELKAVQEAMNYLSDEHKEILILVCVKGIQYQEASEILNIPVGTVRSRLSRARESLKILMESPAVKKGAMISNSAHNHDYNRYAA